MNFVDLDDVLVKMAAIKEKDPFLKNTTYSVDADRYFQKSDFTEISFAKEMSKIASQKLQSIQELMSEAHPNGSTKLDELGSSESVVEGLQDVSKKMRDVAEKEVRANYEVLRSKIANFANSLTSEGFYSLAKLAIDSIPPVITTTDSDKIRLKLDIDQVNRWADTYPVLEAKMQALSRLGQMALQEDNAHKRKAFYDQYAAMQETVNKMPVQVTAPTQNISAVPQNNAPAQVSSPSNQSPANKDDKMLIRDAILKRIFNVVDEVCSDEPSAAIKVKGWFSDQIESGLEGYDIYHMADNYFGFVKGRLFKTDKELLNLVNKEPETPANDSLTYQRASSVAKILKKKVLRNQL